MSRTRGVVPIFTRSGNTQHMDHRNAFEPTVEPLAEPASSEPAAAEPPRPQPAPADQVNALAPAPDATEPVPDQASVEAGAAPAPPVAAEPPTIDEVVVSAGQAEPPAMVDTAAEPPSAEPVGSDADAAEPDATAVTPVASDAPSSAPDASEATSGEPAAAQAPQPAAVDPRRVRAQQAWERVVAAHQGGEHVTGTVTAAVKGGLLVDVGGIRGFLPASQVRVTIGTALDTLVKTKLPLKVLDVDNTRRRIVVSHRRAVDEERRSKRTELLQSLAIGQTREATVARLTDFGAFVDLGGIDGLIPMRELAFERVEKASDVLTVGETVTVQVLRIEENGKKIALSRKNALPDPWRDHAAILRGGKTLDGKVVAKEPQLIVEIAPGVTGAVRADEVNPADYELGEAIEVTVRSVDRVRRRVVLSTLQAATAAAAPQMQMTSSGFAPLGVELSQRKR